jgi:hypothetical protein
MATLPLASLCLRTNFQFSNGAPLKVFGGFRIFLRYATISTNPADYTTLANNLGTEWGSTLATYQNASITLTNIAVTDLNSASGPQVSVPQNVVGIESGTELPVNDAVLINHRIARRYRGGKPKSFLPLGSAADVLQGKTWTSTFVTNVQNAWHTFIQAVPTMSPNLGTLSFVNVSYYSGATEITDPPKWHDAWVPTLRTGAVVDPITSSVVSANISTQRRRTKYGS